MFFFFYECLKKKIAQHDGDAMKYQTMIFIFLKFKEQCSFMVFKCPTLLRHTVAHTPLHSLWGS